MKLFSLKNTVIGSILGSFVLFGAVGLASAQNYNEEYREWQQAQRRAQEEYQDYLRTRSRDDYRDWQQAQRRAQQEYSEYRRSAGSYNRYTNRMGGSRAYTTSRGYRLYRDGNYYEVDNRGAELLRQAVNSGYRQGFQQGQRDARYGRSSGYYGNNMYRSGTYGYQSYVDRNQYQYYFQQGFQRGYEDGYNNQYRYGYRSNNGINILGNILNGILNLSQQ
jgi:hypothetical protein